MINVVTTEVAGLLFYFACLLVVGYSDRLVWFTFLPLTFIFPVAFYHHSWSAWLCGDFWVEGLPQYTGHTATATVKPGDFTEQ